MSQAGSNPDPNPVDQPIKLAKFLSNFVSGLYDRNFGVRPFGVSDTTGQRVLVLLRKFDRRGKPIVDKTSGKEALIEQSLLITDYPTNFNSSLAFSKITQGSGATSAGVYEIQGAGGSFIVPLAAPATFAKGFAVRDALNLVRNMMGMNAAGTVIVLGDQVNPIIMAVFATAFRWAGTPSTNFVLDNQTNVTANFEGGERYHSTGKVTQLNTVDDSNTPLWKDQTILWEQGTATPGLAATSFTVTFANVQVDANYFIELEFTVGNVSWHVSAKSKSAFTITFAALGAADSVNWYAVRWGI